MIAGPGHGRHTNSWCAALSDCLAAAWSCATSACTAACCQKTITLGASGRSLKVRRLLAEGGYSYVYLVEDVKTKVPYALKIMLCHTAEHSRRARWEAEVHQSFAHPNLLALEDVDFCRTDGDKEDARFLFEYIPRGTIQDALNRTMLAGSPFSEREALRVFSGVCAGVRALHSHNPPWAHRDIKPHNVLMNSDGIPILMDFGSTAPARVTISNRFEGLQLQETAQQHCSMPYRAPELFDVPTHATITEKTDIWSLGCLLYALGFGLSPFEVEYGSNGSQRIVECTHLRVLGRVPFPPRHALSKGFENLVLWMLEQDPDKRPDIEAVLERLSHGMASAGAGADAEHKR